MTEVFPKILFPLSVVLAGLFVFYRIIAGSASSNAYMYLAGLIGLEMLLTSLWDYRERFFPVLVVVFLLAGTEVPFHSIWVAARWGVLAVGAIVGFFLYLRNPVHHFGIFHLTALFSVIAALVSALVSDYPRVALLKSLSMLLVFLYGASGARLAILGREAKFCATLLWASEILVYISAFAYFVLRVPLFGNPNSLGVVSGIMLFPLLLWGVIAGEGTRSHNRKILALVLCVLLLFSSYARAAIGAACLSSLVLTLSLRRYRLLLLGGTLALVGAVLVMVIVPLKHAESGGSLMGRMTDTFFYKGEQGLFSSRQTPWQLTSAAIHAHPWFGTGFGTSVTAVEGRERGLSVTSNSGATREHGNSYLAIMEWTGLLGGGPFYFLVGLVVVDVGRVVIWMRRTSNPFSPAVPLAVVLAGALFHATFEDWMFAVGYHMCIIFWAFAFMLIDVLPVPQPVTSPILPAALESPQTWNPSGRMMVPGQ